MIIAEVGKRYKLTSVEEISLDEVAATNEVVDAMEEKVMSKKEMKAAKKASKEASLVIDDVVVVTNEAEVEAVEENRE
ncbi:MAG: hypothetical protein IKZ28_03625, partial [Clostridia bacterium]|nr:hypothetical protein [Clostridia bacterium]